MDGMQELLHQIQQTLVTIQSDYRSLSASVESINDRVDTLAGAKDGRSAGTKASDSSKFSEVEDASEATGSSMPIEPSVGSGVAKPESAPAARRQSLTSRIILTTYPGQAGIDPLVMNWGHADPMVRGPVVVSRNPRTVRRRNGMLCTVTII